MSGKLTVSVLALGIGGVLLIASALSLSWFERDDTQTKMGLMDVERCDYECERKRIEPPEKLRFWTTVGSATYYMALAGGALSLLAAPLIIVGARKRLPFSPAAWVAWTVGAAFIAGAAYVLIAPLTDVFSVGEAVWMFFIGCAASLGGVIVKPRAALTLEDVLTL